MTYTNLINCGVFTLPSSTGYIGGCSSGDRSATISKQDYNTTYAGAQTLYLPSATVGLEYRVRSGNPSNAFTFSLDSGDVFAEASSSIVYSVGEGAMIKLICLEAGKWTLTTPQYNFAVTPATATSSSTSLTAFNVTTLPSRHWRANRAVKFYSAGEFTGTAGIKTLKFHAKNANDTIFTAVVAGQWVFRGVLIHYAALEQRISWQATLTDAGGVGVASSGYFVCTDNANTAINCYISGQCANGADSITQTMYLMHSLCGVTDAFNF